MTTPRWYAAARQIKTLALVALTLSTAGAAHAQSLPAAEYTPNAASASSELWPARNVFDDVATSSWSSRSYTDYSMLPGLEWLRVSWPEGRQKINYIRVLARRVGGAAYGFPSAF